MTPAQTFLARDVLPKHLEILKHIKTREEQAKCVLLELDWLCAGLGIDKLSRSDKFGVLMRHVEWRLLPDVFEKVLDELQ